MSARPDQTTIAEAINALLGQKPEERVYDEITAWVEDGVFDKWKDGANRTLLHFAAAWNNENLTDVLYVRGVNPSSTDNEGRTPADVARAFGHDVLAKKLSGLEQPQESVKKSPAYLSLQDIRSAAQKSGQNVFYDMVSRREFEKVTDLARKDPQGLTAEDLLSKNKYGDTVLLALCRQGSVGLLLEKSLWEGRAAAFDKIWTNVPDAYKKGIDGDSFLSQIKQGNVVARTPFRTKGLRK
jgi:hypothetical protein